MDMLILIEDPRFSANHYKTKNPQNFTFGGFIADRTGLEPATSAVTGRHSNQLNYRSVLPFISAFQAYSLIFRKDTFIL